MSGWNRFAFITLKTLALTGPTWAADVPALAPAPRPVPAVAPDLHAEAARAERLGQWQTALDVYLKLYATGRPTAELRTRIRTCLQNVNRTERHRDPAFQQFVLSLTVADALNLYAEAVDRLDTHYHDRSQATPARLFGLGLDELGRALDDPAFRMRHLANPPANQIQQFRQSLQTEWRHRLPTTARESRHAVRDLVVAAQERLGVRTPSAVVIELLCGACSGLDEFTLYVTPTDDQADLASSITELAAYGVLIRRDGDGLVVDDVVPESWAALATDLSKGDRVTRLNGRAIGTGDPAAIAEALRHPGMAGHELGIEPADAGMMSPVVCLPVPAPTVYAASIVDPHYGVGYVKVGAFREFTPRELDEAVYRLKEQGLKALVVDVRGNAGGLFTAGVEVARRFLPAGVVVSTRGQVPEFAGRVFSSNSGMTAFDVPVVLLIDTRTMSAAETVAAAWKDHDRATLIGLPTFGKGLIQSPLRLSAADGPTGTPARSGLMIVTVASMFGPRGAAIHGAGVTPHVLEADPDRQLDLAVARAIELLAASP